MIPRFTFRFLLLPGFALTFLSCSSSSTFDPKNPPTPDEVMAKVLQRNAMVRTMSGYGRVSIDTPELANTGSISVKLQKPDTLLIDISGPFGVGVAKGLITDKRFVFYNGMENTVVEGETTSRNLRAVLQFPIEFLDMLNILSGTLGFGNRPPNAKVQGIMDGSTYRMVYAGEAFTAEYIVDLEYLSIKKYQRKRSDGSIEEEITFRDFRKRSDLYLPALISISRPLMEESMTLVYDRQVLNDSPLDFSFRIPKSAKRITL